MKGIGASFNVMRQMAKEKLGDTEISEPPELKVRLLLHAFYSRMLLRT
jgi:hypothetical protein